MIFWPLERAKISICRRLIRCRSLLDRTLFTLFKQNCIPRWKQWCGECLKIFLKNTERLTTYVYRKRCGEKSTGSPNGRPKRTALRLVPIRRFSRHRVALEPKSLDEFMKVDSSYWIIRINKNISCRSHLQHLQPIEYRYFGKVAVFDRPK